MQKILFATFICLAIIRVDAHVFYSESMLNEKLSTYTDKEKIAINKDLLIVKSVCFPEQPKQKKHPLYIATAGAPGARKTTILEKFIKNHETYKDCIHLDPDARGLKYMVHTYISQSLAPSVIAETHNYNEVIKKAYEHWVVASTYICSKLLEEALEKQYDIAHGTTLTGELAEGLLKAIKEAGYEVTLLLCGCSDRFRSEAIAYRNEEQRFYQSSPQDTLERAKAFPQKMHFYFTYADHLHFFWSDTLDQPESLAASYENKILTIQNPRAWDCFIQKYEQDRRILSLEGITVPSLEYLMEHRR